MLPLIFRPNFQKKKLNLVGGIIKLQRSLSAKVLIIHELGMRDVCEMRDEIQKVRQVGISWHVKVINQINDCAWQTRGDPPHPECV